MSKELEAFKRIKVHHEIKGKDNSGKVSVVGYINEKELDIVEKSLKALEIIKRKINLTKTNDEKKALVFVILETQEEFDLLKEVLL